MPQPKRHASHADRQAAYRERCRRARLAEVSARGLPPLPAVPSIPGSARWASALAQARMLLETVYSEMQAYYDDRSPEWQESEKADRFTDRSDALAELIAGFDDMLAV
jgi:hypothetical protein